VRNLVASTYVTLDGVFEDPGWSAPYWSDDAQHFARDQLWASDALLMGRKTYEGFAAAWPTEEWIEREGEFAVRMNSLPEYVASRSLSEPLEWSNSQLLEGDVADAVRKLKEESRSSWAREGACSRRGQRQSLSSSIRRSCRTASRCSTTS
jgi:dihydrofolate reductase